MPSPTPSTKTDAYEKCQERILALLEQNDGAWLKPWGPGGVGRAWSLTTGKPYRGINAFMLSLAPVEDALFISRAKADAWGGRIKEGVEPYLATFWARIKITDQATGEKKIVPMLRCYEVFALEDTEGLPSERVEPIRLKAGVAYVPHDPIGACDRLVKAYEGRPPIGHGGDKAFYSPGSDSIGMPALKQFKDAEHYYNTLFHELTHSTGAKGRLNRKEVTDLTLFGSHEYGVEELVAEWGAAMLCSLVGIERVTEKQSADYLASWRAKIKADKKLVVWAAARAQKAADFMTKGLELEDIEQVEPAPKPKPAPKVTPQVDEGVAGATPLGLPVEEPEPTPAPGNEPPELTGETEPDALICFRCRKAEETAPLWKCQSCGKTFCLHVESCTRCGNKRSEMAA